MSERTIGVEDVEEEHLAEVHQPVQWAYLIGVIALGFVAMLLFIAVLGNT